MITTVTLICSPSYRLFEVIPRISWVVVYSDNHKKRLSSFCPQQSDGGPQPILNRQQRATAYRQRTFHRLTISARKNSRSPDPMHVVLCTSCSLEYNHGVPRWVMVTTDTQRTTYVNWSLKAQAHASRI